MRTARLAFIVLFALITVSSATAPQSEQKEAVQEQEPALPAASTSDQKPAGSALFKIDPKSGQISNIGRLNQKLDAMCTTQDGLLYGINAPALNLLAIDPQTGKSEQIGEVPIAVHFMTCAPDGSIYLAIGAKAVSLFENQKNISKKGSKE